MLAQPFKKQRLDYLAGVEDFEKYSVLSPYVGVMVVWLKRVVWECHLGRT